MQILYRMSWEESEFLRLRHDDWSKPALIIKICDWIKHSAKLANCGLPDFDYNLNYPEKTVFGCEEPEKLQHLARDWNANQEIEKLILWKGTKSYTKAEPFLLDDIADNPEDWIWINVLT